MGGRTRRVCVHEMWNCEFEDNNFDPFWNYLKRVTEELF